MHWLPLLVVLPLAACETWDTQLAETHLFNGPASKLVACYGQPDRRIPAGVQQIWVYRVGRLQLRGWVAGAGADERPTFSAPSGDCEARFTVDGHGVRGIAYTMSDGRSLPQGEECDIGVRRCLGLQQP